MDITALPEELNTGEKEVNSLKCEDCGNTYPNGCMGGCDCGNPLGSDRWGSEEELVPYAECQKCGHDLLLTSMTRIIGSSGIHVCHEHEAPYPIVAVEDPARDEYLAPRTPLEVEEDRGPTMVSGDREELALELLGVLAKREVSVFNSPSTEGNGFAILYAGPTHYLGYLQAWEGGGQLRINQVWVSERHRQEDLGTGLVESR